MNIDMFVNDDNAYIKQYKESLPYENDFDDYMTSEGVVKPKIDLL